MARIIILVCLIISGVSTRAQEKILKSETIGRVFLINEMSPMEK